MRENLFSFSRAIIIVWLLCWPPLGSAQNNSYESELNGWRLLQFTENVDEALGQPFTTRDDPPYHNRAYRVGKDAYMVFGTHDEQPQVIASLQLTGTAAVDMLAFKGLKLGDDRSKVIAALGEPTSVTEIDDPKVSRLNYQDGNYTVELDDKRRLYSIRIDLHHDFMKPGDDTDQDWDALVAAVRSRSPAKLFETLRPDMEIYRDGDVLAIRRRYSDFVAAPDAAILDVFFSTSSGVLHYLDACEYEQNVRVSEHNGVGMAYKFNPECPLAEIVLLPYAGQYRVYEVAFRASAHGYAVRERDYSRP